MRKVVLFSFAALLFGSGSAEAHDSGCRCSLTPAVQATSSFGAALAVETQLNVVDILVAYDRSAQDWLANNKPGLSQDEYAAECIEKCNTCLRNSGITEFKFRVAGVVAVEDDASDRALEKILTENLVNVSGKFVGTGEWAKIRAARETTGADIVSVLVDHGTSGQVGLGYELRDRSLDRSWGEWAYNVCSIARVDIDYTFVHEVGHNMGCGHADKACASSLAMQLGPQLYDYSAAYYAWVDDVGYYTVMGYSIGGLDLDGSYNPKARFSPLPYFSSPNLSYEGVELGVDGKNDNVRTLKETYRSVAAYRVATLEPEGVTAAVTFYPESGTRFMEGETLEVSLSCKTEQAVIYYTLDGSAPTAASLIYTNGCPLILDRPVTVRAVACAEEMMASSESSASYRVKRDNGHEGVFYPVKAINAVAPFVGAVYDGNGEPVALAQLKIGKVATSGKSANTSKVTLTIIGFDGKKKASKAVSVKCGEEDAEAVFDVKGWGEVRLWLCGDGFSGEMADGRVIASAPVGGPWAVSSADVQVDFGDELMDGVVRTCLPTNQPMTVAGTKWIFPKAASLKYSKIVNKETKEVSYVLTGDQNPACPNLSAIKLSYAAKAGTFKGSFKVYQILNNKLKKLSVNVTGLAVDGQGYGQAVLKKPAFTWGVRILAGKDEPEGKEEGMK